MKEVKKEIVALHMEEPQPLIEGSTYAAHPLISPCRIDILTENSLSMLKPLYGSFDIQIEEPLPNAKSRGVKYVVFLDKHLIKEYNFTWLCWGY